MDKRERVWVKFCIKGYDTCYPPFRKGGQGGFERAGVNYVSV
jgi:hypothetical protein